MLAVAYADYNWSSERKMRGDEGLKTVDCLRGRLLAERAASRVAKEEAELIGTKLVELESQLKKEIKSKNKAEKKLRLLLGKLQSLKIPYVVEESEQCSSSDHTSETSSISSSGSSGTKGPDGNKETPPKSHIMGSNSPCPKASMAESRTERTEKTTPTTHWREDSCDLTGQWEVDGW